ncbi:MAG TPA: epimerase, partial [Niastella sp.]
GFMRPTKGLKHTLKGYKFFTWLYPVLRPMFPNFVSTLSEVGQAMVNVTLKGYEKPVLEVKDIVKAAQPA